MESYNNGHPSKKQRTDGPSGQREIYEDRMHPDPSPVVHVRGLSEGASDRDLVEALQSFGAISFTMVMGRKRMALVEFEDITGAMALVKYAQNQPVYVGNKQAHFNYSTSQKIQRPTPGDERTNRVLLFSILNPKYNITVDVLHTISSASGKVNRIVIFRKNGIQAMVEFDTVEAASHAKQSLQGADIYSGCCTLKIEFAKPDKLNVFQNTPDSWDYTNPNPGGNRDMAPPRNKPLLADPGYGSRSMDGPSGSGGAPYDFQGGRDSQFGQDRYQGDRYSRDSYGPPSDRGSYDSFGGGGRGSNYGDNAGYMGNQPVESGGGAVLMVYDMNKEKMNCKKVFNLFCLFGNVVRVKFLKSKEGTAMVELGGRSACERAITNLNNCTLFDHMMKIKYSNQAYIQDVGNPFELPDGTQSFANFASNKNNRFSNPTAAAKNRVHGASKCLHFWNAPVDVTEEQLTTLFQEADVDGPSRVKKLPTKSDKSCSGLLEWDSIPEAIEALCVVNHTQIPCPNGKFPFVLRLCFASRGISQQDF